MPALKNQRHESFCQLTLQGAKYGWTQADIYKRAGYRADGHSAEMAASRLMKKDEIRARIAELAAPAVKKTQVTVATLLDDLRKTIDDARAAKQHGVVVSCLTLAAKLVGLLTEKVEVGGPGDFSQAETMRDIVLKVLEDTTLTVGDHLQMLDEMREELLAVAEERAFDVSPSKPWPWHERMSMPYPERRAMEDERREADRARQALVDKPEFYQPKR